MPLADLAVLTDMNPDPAVVEVFLVAAPSTAEYVVGKQTSVWAYRDGAIAGSVGTVPGPMLRAKLGDQIIVHFRNDLPAPITTNLHFHGPRMPQQSDGSHDGHGLHPGDTTEYRFVAEDAGSFWYHPHIDSYDQVERGLHGPMIIDGEVTPEVTMERYLVLDDVKLLPSGAVSEEISDRDRMFGREGNVFLVNGRQAPLNLHAAAGARERWRLVNAANGRFFHLRVPGVRFQVISSDGGLLPEPYWTDTLLIVPGERYDVLVTFAGDAGTSTMLETLHYDRGQGNATEPERLLRIILGAPGATPPPLPVKWRELEPLQVTQDTAVRKFTLGEKSLPGGAKLFMINDQVWPDNLPVKVNRGDLEIWEIKNQGAMDHPIHLHGMYFEVLPDASGRPGFGDGLKDTVNVPRFSTVRLALRLDPPGAWMLQSTILEHAATGMMVNVVVSD